MNLLQADDQEEKRLPAAEVTASALTDPAAGLVGELEAEVARTRRRRLATINTILTIIAVLFISLAAGNALAPGLRLLVPLTCAMIGPVAWLFIWSTRRHGQIAREVAANPAKSALGPLIASVNMWDRRVQDEVAVALSALLPGLTADDAAKLTEEEMRNLNGLLWWVRGDIFWIANPLVRTATETAVDSARRPAMVRHTNRQNHAYELVLRTIGAAPVFGDTTTLERLVKLSELPGRSPRRRAIRRAASEAAPLLAARLEESRRAGALLRPAEPPAVETLLRPAAGTASSTSDELLRPAQMDS